MLLFPQHAYLPLVHAILSMNIHLQQQKLQLIKTTKNIYYKIKYKETSSLLIGKTKTKEDAK